MAVAKQTSSRRTRSEPLVPAVSAEPPCPRPAPGPQDLVDYWLDVGQRTILFLDALRQRAENIVAHERAGKPPLLDFDFEVVAEARCFERPTNYSLLKITRVGEDCLEDCLQPGLPPVVVFDPRAGHGPGIGGFKRESEVGLALQAGHPTYFVSFAPEPVAGQTLHDVLRTLRRFLEEVGRRHPGEPPVLYGNCQAGWAITMLAADCQGLVGTAVLNGSPLSYWAGEPGVNPMRTGAGFTGGMWTAHLLSDLGDGRFDGAWLVQNFEALKPEGVWSKYADLFERVRTERERFLDFERWWNGFYVLGREEILAITENLFVGNRLEQGLVRLCQHCNVDLRRIRNPLV
ncbi:poly(3-hydroxyalkanoate) synthetase, partial [Alsobacter soli]